MYNKKNSVTNSKYWKYIDKKNFGNTGLLNSMKILFENFFNIKIIKKKNYNNNNEKNSYLKSKNVIKVRNFYLMVEIINFLKKFKISSNQKKIFRLIKMHDKIFYKQSLFVNNHGGIGYNNSLLIYIFFNHLKLDMILESGVWKGYTTFLFDKYPKKIKKISFDINLKHLEYVSKKTKYIEDDIINYNFGKINNFSKTLAFFDDHVSQYDRLKFSDKLKISFIIFDDDVEFSAVHSDGWPSIPTLSMIISPLKIKKFSWKSINKNAHADFRNMKFGKILNKYTYVKAPNISRITGYYEQSPMSFLIRK